MASRNATLLALLVLAAACTRTTLQGSIADAQSGRDETTELDFWDGLAEQKAVSNHDALHALLVTFTDNEATDYAGREKAARDRGWIRGNPLAPNETARVGWVARAVCLELNLRGGLMMRTLGARERYAVRELNHLGWLPRMSPNQAISGLRLIALLSSAEDHESTRPDRPQDKEDE